MGAGKLRPLKPILLALSLAYCGSAFAEPSMTGQTGLIYMPDARIAPDGTWRTGYSFTNPYRAIWTSLSVMPRVEASFRYTEIDGVPAFTDRPNIDFGDFKDKAFDFKFVLTEEGRWWPSLAVGAQDLAEGTKVFRAGYGTLGKRLGDFDFTLGYGMDRIDGVFGGVRYSPNWLPYVSLVAEYDANDYPNDFRADISGVAQRKKDVVGGIEFRKGWFGAQANYGHDEAGLNAYVAIPLQQKVLVPDINEPEPYVKITPRPSMQQWISDSSHEQRMLSALIRQDFKDVRIVSEGYTITAVLTNTRISQMSRAVGRAARTILNLSPVETHEIRIVYTLADMPFATYTFVDLKRLERYFNGLIGRAELADHVLVEFSQPADGDVPAEKEALMAVIEEDNKVQAQFFDPLEGDIFSLRTESASLQRFKVSPDLSLYLNDPSGAFRYTLLLRARYDRRIARKTFFTGAVGVTLLEGVSDVTQESNSTLPHVRTDIAKYFDEKGGKLDQLLLTRVFNPRERVYARATAGIYELMYSGVGGQVLYIPQDGNWATDLSVDWLRQRDFRGLFNHLDYETVTALGAVHYRIPYYGLTTTLRVGRFLAKDNGARVEIKRRFKSGIELGAWYTVTDGNDITSPGSPENPYYDKGVFAVIPLYTLLTRDTQTRSVASIEPWTRDVGQMVLYPVDLYSLLEDPLRNKADQDGLVRLGDFEDDPYVAPPPNAIHDAVNWDAFRYYLSEGTSSVFSSRTFWYVLGGAAAVGLSYGADDDVDDWANDHQNDRLNRNLADASNITTFGMLGASALAALDRDNPRLSRTAVTSLQSAAVSLAASAGLNYAVGRAKPELNLGKDNFESGRPRNQSSFPSDMTTLAWATVTPYAKEYQAPWLYGLAALTNIGAVAERRHWLSDTVAGSLLGWGIGSLMWELNRDREEGAPRVTITPNSVQATWEY